MCNKRTKFDQQKLDQNMEEDSSEASVEEIPAAANTPPQMTAPVGPANLGPPAATLPQDPRMHCCGVELCTKDICQKACFFCVLAPLAILFCCPCLVVGGLGYVCVEYSFRDASHPKGSCCWKLGLK